MNFLHSYGTIQQSYMSWILPWQDWRNFSPTSFGFLVETGGREAWVWRCEKKPMERYGEGKHQIQQSIDGCFLNMVVPPKWMVYKAKPYCKMDDLGGKPTIFGITHIDVHRSLDLKTYASLDQQQRFQSHSTQKIPIQQVWQCKGLRISIELPECLNKPWHVSVSAKVEMNTATIWKDMQTIWTWKLVAKRISSYLISWLDINSKVSSVRRVVGVIELYQSSKVTSV